MNLGLSALTALVLLMPGFAGLAGLRRPILPSATLIDQSLVAYLMVLVASSAFAHAVAIPVLQAVPFAPDPDIGAAMALLGATDGTQLDAAFRTLAESGWLAAIYIFFLSAFSYGIGRLVEHQLPVTRVMSWLELLGQPESAQLVVISADVLVDDTTYLYSGIVRQFSVDRSGKLTRVLLNPASRSPFDSKRLQDGIKCHGLVLELAESKTLCYRLVKKPTDRQRAQLASQLGVPTSVEHVIPSAIVNKSPR